MKFFKYLGVVGKPVIQFVKNHSNAFLTGGSITGLFLTSYLSAKEAIIAKERLDDLIDLNNGEDPGLKEKLKVTVPVMLPAIGSGLLTTGCIVANTAVASNKNAALSAALAISERGLSEYQSKVIDKFGEKADGEIRKSISEDHTKAESEKPGGIIFTPTGKGNYPIHDKAHDRYFYASITAIDNAVNAVNSEINSSWDGFCSMNRFYEELGLSGVLEGNSLGWYRDRPMEIYHGEGCYEGVPGTSEPCFVLEFANKPVLYDPKRDTYLKICG